MLKNRYRFLVGIFIVGFLAISIRLFHLGKYGGIDSKLTQQGRQRVQAEIALRGNIIDCKGRCLANQLAVYEVGVDLTQVRKEDEDKLGILADILTIPIEKLQSLWKAHSNKRWVPLAKNIKDPSYKKIQALEIKGVYGNKILQRRYLHSPSLSYIIGFLNKDNQPVCGIEKMMQFYLKGQGGYLTYEVNGKRAPLSVGRYEQLNSNNGCTVELTIDDRLQSLIEAILVEAKEKYRAISAQALVTHPYTGEVIAFVNVPYFDSNHYNRYPIERLTNRAVVNVFEPGSIYKSITISAALDCGVINTTEQFDCSLSTAFYKGKERKLPNDWKPFNQRMRADEVLSHSSNRGAAQIAFKLGEERMYEYGRKFGFGQSTQSGFESETNGIFKPVEQWDGLTITRLPSGHGMACTILQLHYAVSAIANGGKLMYPKFIRRIYDHDGNILQTFEPKVRREVIKPSVSKLMCQMLLSDHTSKAFIKGYHVASKTGTAQKIINGRYSRSEYVSSITGFFPNTNPQVHITVVLDNPHIPVGVPYGSVTAGPVFRKIAQTIIAYWGIEPIPSAL